jgi:hypothetical protein
MSAYNWLLLDERCPICGGSKGIRAQMHTASDYDGDESGRFHDREYRVGDEMRWWPVSDPRFKSWRADRRRGEPLQDGELDEEACYAECLSCHARLYVVVRFRKTRVERVLLIGREEDWPRDFLK